MVEVGWPPAPVAIDELTVAAAVLDASHLSLPVVWVNQQFTALTGYCWGELMGAPALTFAGSAPNSAQMMVFSEAIRSDVATSGTMRLYRKDGSAMWCEVALAPIATRGEETSHWLATLRDVSATQAAIAARDLAVERAQDAVGVLACLTAVSDVVADIEDRMMLQEVARLLMHDQVAYASFVLVQPLHFEAPVLNIDPGWTAGSVAADPVAVILAHNPVTTQWVTLADVNAVQQPATAALIHILDDLPIQAQRVRLRPLVGQGEVLGLLVDIPVGTSWAKTPAVDHIARRVSAALVSAKILARERMLAETLQTALLPDQAELSDLDVWSYYAPSSHYAQVGGDWYDVNMVGSDVVAAVVGDVVGHDVHASAAMGQLRAVVRAFGMEMAEPALVLERTDAVATAMRVPRAASIVYGSFFREAVVGAEYRRGGHQLQHAWSLFYSRAGHPPPLLLRGGHVEVLTGGAGPLIGFESGARPQAEVHLEPGDVIVMYTDGLMERRDRSPKAGMFALVNALAQCRGDATDIGEELVARLGEGHEDDTAIVIVRVPWPGEDPSADRIRSRRWAYPSEVTAVARARHASARVCHEWGIERAEDVELVISELVGNAVVHGGGFVRVRLFDCTEGVRIEVEDGNPTPPLAVEGHTGRPGGMGVRFVERLARWGWQPTADGKLVWALVKRR